MNLDKGMWIIGAGGIGAALAEKSRQEGVDVKLISRPNYDMTRPEDVERFFETIEQLPSVIVNTIGMLHDANHVPEKSLSVFDADWFNESMRVNAMPVMWIAKALSQKLLKQDELLFITLSARVASISDNRLGGWHSYRASKCALNMLIKNISVEWSLRFPKVVICGYHPGTVETRLSEPFKKNLKADSFFSPELAANYLFAQIQKIRPEMTGLLFDWKGETITF